MAEQGTDRADPAQLATVARRRPRPLRCRRGAPVETETQPIRLRNDDLTWRLVDSEVIVLDRRNWGYITINDSGALLWERLAAGATEAELVSVLADAFAIDPEEARGDVHQFLGALRDHDLVAAA